MMRAKRLIALSPPVAHDAVNKSYMKNLTTRNDKKHGKKHVSKQLSNKQSSDKQSKPVLHVSDVTYQRQLAKGLDPESLLTPGTHRFQRTQHVIKADEAVKVNGKLRVTMYVDADIIEFFRRRGTRYQTELNRTLRQVVEREAVTQELVQELVSDEVVEKLASRLAETLKEKAAR